MERKILTVKEMMKVAHDSEIKGAILTRVAVVNCVQAIVGFRQLSVFWVFSLIYLRSWVTAEEFPSWITMIILPWHSG